MSTHRLLRKNLPRKNSRLRLLCAAGCAAGLLIAADVASAAAKLTAEQIVAKYAAARGGLAAWHAVQTMSWSGKMDVGTGDSTSKSTQFAQEAMVPKTRRDIARRVPDKLETPKQVQLPFVVDMKRPALSRVEIVFAGKTAVQVYDGKNGWKLRPYLNRNDVEPFTEDELKASVGGWDIDGPLLGAAARGTKVEVEAIEPVEGKEAYRLKLTPVTGNVQHIWIDAQSFLDVKVEGTPRRMDGKMHTVWIYQRDFRSEQGVMVPHVLETAVDGYPDTHKMVIEKVAVNPALNDTLFAKPSGA
ncbi:MAG: LolA-like protein [Steroidobacteraceae bacterium]